METETKLNFLAIMMAAVAVILAGIAFSPFGGLLMLLFILFIASEGKKGSFRP